MTNRRDFFKQASMLTAGGVMGGSVLSSCKESNPGGSVSTVSPPASYPRINYGIYDSHVHASGGAGLQAFLDAGRKLIDENVQVSAINLLVRTGNSPRSVSAALMALALKTIDPRFTAYGGFAYWMSDDGPGLRAQLEEMMDVGYDGLKMIEGKPTSRRVDPALALDHPRYNLAGEWLQETGWHILNHVNDPEEFWFPDQVPSWSSSSSSGGYWETTQFLPKEQHYQEHERWVERYPNMNIMMAHAYFLSNFPDRLTALFERFPNISIDLCPGIEMYEGFTKYRDQWLTFFPKYQDRIVFGTDNRLSHLEQNVGHDGSYYDRIAYMRRFLETDDKFEAWGYNLHGFALPAGVIDKIYSGNYLRMRGPIRPVVPAKALKYANKLYDLVKDNPDVSDITKQECREVIAFFEQRL